MKDFDPDEIMAAVNEDVRDLVLAIGQRAIATIVLSTPIGMPHLWLNPPPKDYTPGNARGSWNVSIGAPSDAYSEDTRDPAGSSTIASGEAVLGGYKLPLKLFINNNAPHISALDTGWSRQAPAGFTDKAFQVANAAIADDRREIA